MNDDLPPRASLKFARTDPADPAFRVRYLNSADLWSAPRLTQVVDVRHARMVYLSGQAPADAGYKVASQDFRAQMHKVFDNIEIALLVVVAVSLGPVAFEFVRHRRQAKSAAAPTES